MQPVLVLVGGFLGAGKTTLLLEAARRLIAAGSRVALITNDQSGSLVDTHLAAASGVPAEEITAGCFCCHFSDLVSAAERLVKHDVILAEPVGSCIDIAATVLQPLKQLHGDRFRLAPFTVLVEAERARELLAPDADPSLAYLFTNQIAEADLVCISKADVCSDTPELPARYVMRLSAATGDGVSEWLTEVLAGAGVAGANLLRNVDYRKYAEAEAALGWLNWRAELALVEPLSPALVVGPLLDDLDRDLSSANAAIAHLKIFDQASSGYVKASVCRNGEEPVVQGNLDASPCSRHDLVINLRATSAPELLEAVVSRNVQRFGSGLKILYSEAFRPAAPRPEVRMEATF